MRHTKINKFIYIIFTISLVWTIFVGCNSKTDETISSNTDTNLEQKQTYDNQLDTITNENIYKESNDNNGVVALPTFNVETDKLVTVMTHWINPKVGDPDIDAWPQEVRLLKQLYDVDVKYIKIPAAEILAKQATTVMAGDPADVVSVFARDYPNSFTNGLYEPLDELLPLDSKIFDAAKKYIDTLKINGKAYLAPHLVRPTPPNFIYNKILIEEAGLEDPWELVQRNEWTWDKFFDYCKQLTVDRDGDGITDQYGAAAFNGFINNMVNTLGYPISKIKENNQVEINLRDEGLMAYYEFLKKLGPFGEGVFHPLSFKQGDSEIKCKEEFLNGNIGFYYGWDDGTAIKNTFRPMLEKGQLGQTILPRYPNADKQYLGVQVDGLGISKGAKHPQTAAAYITLCASSFFKSAKEIIEDNKRISDDMKKELGIDVSSLNSDYALIEFEIYNSIKVNNAPANTMDYIGRGFYIERQYIKDFPERVVFDLGQYANLTNYYAFEKIFSGDGNGNPVTAQQVIEEIEPQIKIKIDEFEDALNR